MGQRIQNTLGEVVNSNVQTALGFGTTLSLSAIRRTMKNTFAARLITNYQYADYESAKRHVVTITAPLEWTRDFGNRRRFSVGVAPGFMLVNEGDIKNKAATIMGSASISF